MAAGAIGIGLTLALQLDLMIDGVAGRGLPPWFGIVVFSSFFTMWTNIMIAAVLLVSAARPGSAHFLCGPRLKFALAPSIVLVGAVFALMLRNVYPSTGLQGLCNVVFHYVVPPLYLAYWITVVPKGGLRWRDAWIWLAFPCVYFAWVMGEAAVTGFYPYPFYDVGALGLWVVLQNALELVVMVLVLNLATVALGRSLASRETSSSARTIA